MDRPPVLEVPPALRDRIDRVIDIPVVTRLPPGRLAEPISVDAAELTSLLRVAFTTPADPAPGQDPNEGGVYGR
ncbi:MAG TPA: hypothetical protein VFH23_12900 [Jiangellaceae bacterium]|nr:hypothetical protein [Jiangellaceae bacterium]